MSQSGDDLSGDENLSSDEAEVPAKRARYDTHETASTSSHDSAQDSDDEAPHTSYSSADNKKNNTDQSPRQARSSRLSSSLSENCSSPNEPGDFYRRGFDDNEGDGDAYSTSSFQMDDSPRDNRSDDNLKEMNDVYKNYSDKAKRMMSNMGYKAGHGLGKLEHGRVEPVEASTQKGRRGLGMKPSTIGEVPSDFSWTPDTAAPEAKETVSWMPPPPKDTLSVDTLEMWLQKGPKKLIIDDETNFVKPSILKGVLDAKTIFDKLHDEDMRSARSRSNPYESIGSVFFLNRAAVKMANMDAVFDYMFTEPKHPNGQPAVDKDDLLYFADVCAGPGGFSEYVLYRKGWRAKGFGFTLKSSNDFKLSDFYAGTAETFYPYYGVKEDGDIYDPANLMSLKSHVLSRTEDKGVHFLMADGGFSVEGKENIQEILSKQLYLCQCLAALMLVRTGGSFVVKLFDIFTPFSVGLIYIMYRCFERVCIHKPVTSRPANSERYLICKWKKFGTESAEKHLFSVNTLLWKPVDSKSDVTELVPLEVIQQDTAFFEYIYKSNCILGEKQIKNLLKIAAFSKDKNLREPAQVDMKTQCLQLWNIPEKQRAPPKKMDHDETLKFILSNVTNPTYRTYNPNSFKSNVLNKPPEYLDRKSKLDQFSNVYDWHFTFLTNGLNKTSNLDKDMIMTMFLGCGGKKVYQLKNDKWQSVNLNVNFPAKTLLYGEIIKEYSGERLKQQFCRAFHVIDAIMLGGIDISSEPLSKRVQQCSLFCSAIENPSEGYKIRSKRFYSMENFPSAVCDLEYRNMKRGPSALAIKIPRRNDNNDEFYVVGSIIFMKQIKEPWSTHISKTTNTKYYYRHNKENPKQSCSEYNIVEEAALDAITAYSQRLLWPWDVATPAVTRQDMEHFILSKTKISNMTVGETGKNLPWVEKYRPSKLEDLVSHDDIIKTIGLFMKENQLPHLLFYGPPGTGKTSTILACARQMYTPQQFNSMVLELNASDDRGIGIVRGQILSFASTRTIFKAGPKLIILDEADAMTNDAQNALRRIIEKYTDNVRFCIICNYLGKIIPALQSRCTRFRFAPLHNSQIVPRLHEIAAKENVEMSEDGVKALLALSGGDMRKVLNTLQSTWLAHRAVTERAVHACVGHPLRADINDILNWLLNENDFAACFKHIQDLKIMKGLALGDILTEVHTVIQRIKLPPEVLISLLIKMSDSEARLASGCSERIELAALIAAFQEARDQVKIDPPAQ
ncbi:cap-specific mRNA (nucleoside-2'-O-)-methyltransferase 1-like [Epargyreus clarus]|uniref:cap-specific mRNA (nucleoside-2'-O-)-methyltransferase 1-like n=1 Tax=Epargyreus clarus TaxID=520877 RepID=UPI003C2C63FB